MKYLSTRGNAPLLGFSDAMLAGLASDGGLYLPDHWPRLDIPSDRLTYQEIAHAVLLPFIDGEIPSDDLKKMIDKAYATFRDPAIVPIRPLENNIWMMELFHGPTFAFKDVALQLLGHLYDYVLNARDRYITVIGATSGDTGSAAIEACKNKERVRIFMLHPKGRVSDIQRRQMTHVASENVFNIAIEGSFDDCQELVKALFAEEKLRKDYGLAAVNSINWARIAAQICYYVAGAMAFPSKDVAFAVPSGNFGNVYSGWAAKEMGASIKKLIIGTNSNDTLARFFQTRELSNGLAVETYSPSMDVQIPSNLERLLFHLYERDTSRLAIDLKSLRKKGHLAVPSASKVTSLFSAYSFDNAQTLKIMRDIYDKTGQVIDPHSAIGLAAAMADREKHDLPIITLATAHPAKFPAIVEKALGVKPEMPAKLSKIWDLPERYVTLPNDLAKLRDYVQVHAYKGSR